MDNLLFGLRPPAMGHGARLLYLAVALPFHSIVGLALTSSRAPLWSAHSLADQQAGGGVLLLGGDLITVALLIVVFLQWARAEERAAARSDTVVTEWQPPSTLRKPGGPTTVSGRIPGELAEMRPRPLPRS